MVNSEMYATAAQNELHKFRLWPSLSESEPVSIPINPVQDTTPKAPDASRDPVMQAILQQLEYTKQAPTVPASGVGRVMALPGGSSGGNGQSAGVLVLLVLVVVVGGYFYVSKQKKRKGGVTHVES